MSIVRDTPVPQEYEGEESNMTTCERCGFPCNYDTDEVCPWCKDTDKKHGYQTLKF